MSPVRVIRLDGGGGVRIESPDNEIMWILKEKRIAFIADPRTGSREIGYNVLKLRGFERWLGHHGVPWGGDNPRHPQTGRHGDLWWWFNEDLYNWRFYAAHRNHFEVFHSIGRGVLGGKEPSPERFTDYVWKHPALYRNKHILFPAFFEIATCQELRFAHLRNDLDAMLRKEGLNPLKPDEFHRSASQHHTKAKPRDERYQDFLPTDCRLWIEDTYGAEMERFGYAWED